MKLNIARLGSVAARVFRSACEEARIAAVFQRSLHIEAETAIVCVGDESIGNGPLNAIIEASGAGWTSRLGRVGATVRFDDGVMRSGGVLLDARRATEWAPPVWPREINAQDCRRGLARVFEISRGSAPEDGLARLAMSLDDVVNDTPVARVSAPRLRAFADWLSVSAGSVATEILVLNAATGLLGLGPGLTPSGDDLLCGAMIALHAAGLRDPAFHIARAVEAVAAERTTRLSRDFLRAAGEGQGSELLHEVIAAVLSGEEHILPSLIERIGRVGHTSGWDALAGAMLAITAFAEAARETKFP